MFATDGACACPSKRKIAKDHQIPVRVINGKLVYHHDGKAVSLNEGCVWPFVFHAVAVNDG